MTRTRIEAVAGRPWHAEQAQEVLAQLETRAGGLPAAEASRRLAEHGPNRLRPPKRAGPVVRFLLQFHNVLIYVLLAAAVVTAFLEHWIDTGVIVGVVVVNAIIGFLQEGKAERALDAIRDMLSLHAIVLRDGQRREIAAEEVVAGDIVLLASGDKVPADLRLLAVRNLRVDEAALTGESEAVAKDVAAVDAGASIGDRLSMAYSGTLVTSGQATGVVVATGMGTELGRISELLESVEELTTPLLAKIGHFGRVLTVAILAFSAAAFAFGMIVRGFSAGEMFLAAVGLAVAAIPEGLPAIMTVTLAIGVQRMARRNAIIRRLPAVETLGSVTVICSDKTGTLTRNEMAVRRIVTRDAAYDVSGTGYAPIGGFSADGATIIPETRPDLVDVLRAALLCNDAQLAETGNEWLLTGDPTEGALLACARKAGLYPDDESGAAPRTDEIPFESDHRFMATLHHDHAGHGFIYVKGAPERVLDMCASERRGGEDVALEPRYWHGWQERIAAEGGRLLAIAMRATGADHRELRFDDMEGGFTLLGLAGLSDPPRDEAIAAIGRCHDAGIRVKMITGDHAVTAAAIGRQLGIGDGTNTLTGAEIERLDDPALERRVGSVDVFARASPEHKLRLVKALQAQGEIVAMTGDGVNDAPALKRADVGVAMGRKGTEAAKEASDMVLADDNFASIAAAVEEGRTVFTNLRKFIVFALPTNGGEAGVILMAIVMGLTLPITPAQVLWVNMVTAVTLGLALAFEPAEAGIMRRRPRPPAEPILSRFLVWRIVFVSATLVAGIGALFLWESGRGSSIEEARTVAVNALVMGEIVYLFNCRHLSAPAFTVENFVGNRVALAAVAALAALQVAFTHVPLMNRLFGTAALGPTAWALVLAFGAALFLLVEAEKAMLRARRRARG